MKVTALDGQGLFDIAIQHDGAAEAAFDIAGLNGLSVTNVPASGQQLEVAAPQRVAVANYYSRNGIVPVTGQDAAAITIDRYVIENHVNENYIDNDLK